MKLTFQKYIALGILLCCFTIQAQEKHEIKPYSIATTYEKLKKDYPFINPISPLTSDNITAIENVVYKTTKERDLKADVYLPKTEGAEKYPSVLLIHGGGWLTGSKENERVMAQHLANNGYVAVTAAYRLGTEAKYPAAVEDLKDALKWMQKNSDKYHINSDEIAVLGASAGAQLATLLGVNDKSVKAIVNVDGIVSFVHPDDRKITENIKSVIINGQKIFQFENRYICKDGSAKWLSWNTFPYKDEEIMYGVARDVTENKEQREKLRTLSRAVEQSPVSIIITDPEGFIKYANPKTTEVTGYEFKELYGNNPRIFKSGEQSNDFYDKLWGKILSGKRWQGELHNKKKN